MGLLEDLNPNNLRYLIYAVTPEETTFSSIDDVPDYTKMTTVWMAVLLITEMIISRKSFALNDTITSASSGILYLLFKFSGKYLSAYLYSAVYEKVHLVSLDPYSPWTWILCFFTQDLAYYLAHRCMHECGIFWAFHQVHHSSEYYNLSTAMRKGVFLELGAFGFDLMQAVLIPPEIFLPHKYLNLLFQFWLHTQLIPHLGPLEWIINTPSSHRVHHGRNPYCIDRNYAGTLIIWDRLFGTYAAERTDEPISYGLVENVKSFNQMWIQWFDFGFFLYGKGLLKNAAGKPFFPSIINKITAIFAPPGYYPGVKTRQFFFWRYLEDSTFGIPEVDHSEPKYNPVISTAKELYILSHFVFLVSFVLPFYERRHEMDWMEFAGQLTIIMSTIQVFGYYFDNDPLATFHDKTRCYAMLGYIMRHPSTAIGFIALMSLPCITYFEGEIQAAAEDAKKPSVEEVKDENNGRREKKKRSKKTD